MALWPDVAINGTACQGSDVEKYYLLNVVLGRQELNILPFDEKNLDGDMEIIAGNAVQITTSKLPMRTSAPHRYHEFLAALCVILSAWSSRSTWKTSTTGMLSHVLSHITDTSLIEMEQVVVR